LHTYSRLRTWPTLSHLIPTRKLGTDWACLLWRPKIQNASKSEIIWVPQGQFWIFELGILNQESLWKYSKIWNTSSCTHFKYRILNLYYHFKHNIHNFYTLNTCAIRMHLTIHLAIFSHFKNLCNEKLVWSLM
jgi:hypothetical protein